MSEFESREESLESGNVTRYVIHRAGRTLTYAQVLDGWQQDRTFAEFFNGLLARCKYEAFRWETPPISSNSLEQPFEFVLISAPGFTRRTTDSVTYRHHFRTASISSKVVIFPNLSGKSLLICPTPIMADHAYGHLAAFVRQAPSLQQHALWETVGVQLANRICETPVWLSTAGGGVAWLHVRLDPTPKYYHHDPYRKRR